MPNVRFVRVGFAAADVCGGPMLIVQIDLLEFLSSEQKESKNEGPSC